MVICDSFLVIIFELLLELVGVFHHVLCLRPLMLALLVSENHDSLGYFVTTCWRIGHTLELTNRFST